MRKCSNCGAFVNEGEVFCSECGARVDQKSSFISSPKGLMVIGIALALGVGSALGLNSMLNRPTQGGSTETARIATENTSTDQSASTDIVSQAQADADKAKAQAESDKAKADAAKAEAAKAEAEKAKAEAEAEEAKARAAEAEAKAKAAEAEAQAKANSSSSSQGSSKSTPSFPRTWYGTYDGHDMDHGTVYQRPITFHFTDIGSDGSLYGYVEIWVEEDSVTASYYVSGSVDWDSGYFIVGGAGWIDSSGLSNMRTFEGYVNSSRTYVSGTTWNDEGNNVENWSASA